MNLTHYYYSHFDVFFPSFPKRILYNAMIVCIKISVLLCFMFLCSLYNNQFE